MKFSNPHIIIAGVNKAGTTSLFTYLSNHPSICPSSVKETCYFLPLRYQKELQPFEVYKNYFNNCDGTNYYLESTPGYFYGGNPLVSAIKEKLPGVKLIFALRNPVERIISFYQFKKNQLELPAEMAIEDYIDKCISYSRKEFTNQSLNPYFGIEGGKYIDYIKDWELFKSKDMLFVDFEHMKSNPQACLPAICSWLKLDSSFYNSYDFQIENKSMAIKNRGMQKFALKINKGFEPFLRKNESIKKSLRSIYYRVNGSKSKELISEATIESLEQYYKAYNQQLANYFVLKERKDMPGWLSDYIKEPIN